MIWVEPGVLLFVILITIPYGMGWEKLEYCVILLMQGGYVIYFPVWCFGVVLGYTR